LEKEIEEKEEQVGNLNSLMKECFKQFSKINSDLKLLKNKNATEAKDLSMPTLKVAV